MRFGITVPLEWQHNAVEELVSYIRGAAEAGVRSVWSGQTFSVDAMTGLAIAAREVPGVAIGTSIVQTYPRHPVVMASQAKTVQAATGGRFTLGVGLSAKPWIEDRLGYSFERPARHLREYLSALVPLLNGEKIEYRGETVTAVFGDGFATSVPGAGSVPVLVAALNPLSLKITGELADGTVTYLTGPRTLESHIVPTLNQAAEQSGRPVPRTVAAMPICVTGDPERARADAVRALGFYGRLPAYRAMLDREGAAGPEDVALIGDEDEVAAGLRRLADAGATEVVGSPAFGTPEEKARSVRLIGALSA